MNAREIAHYMKERGFTEKRTTRHGTVWTDGISDVMTNRKLEFGYSQKNMQAEVEKAVGRREARMRAAEAALYREQFPSSHALKARDPLSVTLGAMLQNRENRRKVIVLDSKPEPIPAPPPVVTVQEEKKEMYAVKEERPQAQIPPSLKLAQPVAKNTQEFRKKTQVKYTEAKRAEVWGMVEELAKEGKNAPETAVIMNTMGYTRPAGEPINPEFVNNVKLQLREKSRKAVEIAAEYSPGPAPLAAMAASLEQVKTLGLAPPKDSVFPRFNYQELEPRIMAHEAAKKPEPVKRKLPDAVVNILTDPDLTDGEKVRMISAWAGV